VKSVSKLLRVKRESYLSLFIPLWNKNTRYSVFHFENGKTKSSQPRERQ